MSQSPSEPENRGPRLWPEHEALWPESGALVALTRFPHHGTHAGAFIHALAAPARDGSELTIPSDRFAARQRRCATDRGDVGLVGFHRTALKHRGACHQRVGAGSGELA